MNYYLLLYHLVDDYLERRGEYRTEHLQLVWEAFDRGELLLGGAVAEPADTAVLVFRGNSADIAKQFAAGDPYLRHGLVERWEVRQWNVVISPEHRPKQ